MTHKILVVDDVPKNVKLLADVLAVKGYEVMTAESGPEALRRVEEKPPDLILLDVMMPGMSGYEVCHAIRARPATRMLPIVLVTALDTSERVKGLDCGADDFITKPINQQELLARVSKLNAQERGDDPDGELKRTVVRIVRDGAAPAPGPAP